MSRENPRTPEWAAYYAAHPEVAASWSEANDRPPRCVCARCAAARGLVQCSGGGERWEGVQGQPRCPGCGARAVVLVGRAPGRARTGGYLGHVPDHLVGMTTVKPAASRPQYGVQDVRPSPDFL